MSVVILTARPFTHAGQPGEPLEFECRGRAWLAIPVAGDVIHLDVDGTATGTEAMTVNVARRRFRTNGDLELELRAGRLTHAQLHALGFRSPAAPELRAA